MSVETAEVLRVIGRLLLGGLFVAGGIRDFFILPVLTQVMSTRGVPARALCSSSGPSSLSLGCF
jgi:putative oxidoreductase